MQMYVVVGHLSRKAGELDVTNDPKFHPILFITLNISVCSVYK